MKNQTLRITQSALMLALLISLQWFTRGFGQLVTGSCVNAVLAATTLLCGLGSGMAVALLSPIFACLLGIAPQVVTVPAIMAGNAVYVLALHLLAAGSQPLWKQIAAWLIAAALKFAVLHLLVAKLICGAASAPLLQRGLLKAPMLSKLPAMFTWPQLITALIGGSLALLIVPAVKRSLHHR